MNPSTYKHSYAKVPSNDTVSCRMSKDAVKGKHSVTQMYSVTPTGSKYGVRVGSFMKLKLPTWRFWNLVNLGQTLHLLMFSYLCFSAVAELTMHEFMTMEEWWGVQLGLTLLTYAATVLPGLQEACTSTLHSKEHNHPFYVHVITQIVQHTILFALLTYFQFGLSEARRNAFAHARYSNAIGFDFFTGALWYSIMILYVSFFTHDVQLMVINWLRHANPKVETVMDSSKLGAFDIITEEGAGDGPTEFPSGADA